MTLKDRILLAVILLFSGSVYLTGLNNPFLGVEIRGLLFSTVFTSLPNFLENFASLKGLLHRPLAMLTFALQFEFIGSDPAAFRLFNILLHLLNTVLVWKLAALFSAPPALTALIFALHPVQTSGATLLFGRPYVLGTLFFLLALLISQKYLLQRKTNEEAVPPTTEGSFNGQTPAAILFLWMLMILSKQTFVIFPAVFIWLILHHHSRALSFQDCKNFFNRYYYLLVGGLTVTLLLVFGYALPFSRTAVVSPEVYFLSQLGNFSRIAALTLLVPIHTALLHDHPWYSEAFHLNVIAGALLVSVLCAFAWLKRSHSAAFALGAFFLLLVPTNSFFPKDQVLVEWRLYPAMVFFALFAAIILKEIWIRLSKPALLAPASVLLIAVSCSFLTLKQIREYSSIESAYLGVLEIYPRSLFALNDLGNHYARRGDLDRAEYYLLRAHEVAPGNRRVLNNLRRVLRQKEEFS